MAILNPLRTLYCGLYGCRWTDWGNGQMVQVCDADGGDPYGGGCRTAECAAEVPPLLPPDKGSECSIKCNLSGAPICGAAAKAGKSAAGIPGLIVAGGSCNIIKAGACMLVCANDENDQSSCTEESP